MDNTDAYVPVVKTADTSTVTAETLTVCYKFPTATPFWNGCPKPPIFILLRLQDNTVFEQTNQMNFSPANQSTFYAIPAS